MESRPPFKAAYRFLKISFGVVLFLTLAAFFAKGRLPGTDDLLPQLTQEPVQVATDYDTFTFHYRGNDYEVKPVADYELWGLVVSHNNITGWTDIYHDSSSVDTKDLCVIWGVNVAGDGYRKIKYKSGAWTCYVMVPGSVYFAMDDLSNNHIITDDDHVREMVAKVNIGDQVYLKGQLVDYRSSKNPGFWRKTSQNRQDTGDGACEVVYLEDIEILSQGTPISYFIFDYGRWILVLLIVLAIATLVLESYTTPKPIRSSRWG